jgi:hypothetical protein
VVSDASQVDHVALHHPGDASSRLWPDHLRQAIAIGGSRRLAPRNPVAQHSGTATMRSQPG